MTNYHFGMLDLIFEGVVPMVAASVAVGSLLRITRLELALFGVYAQWYQIGSHCAKAMPVFSCVPPLSWLYNHLCVRSSRSGCGATTS